MGLFFSLSIASRKYDLADWWKQLNHRNIPEAIWSVKITKYRSCEGFVPLRKHLSLFFKMIEHYASNYGYLIGIEFLNEKEDNFFCKVRFSFLHKSMSRRGMPRYIWIFLYIEENVNNPFLLKLWGALFRVKGNKFALILLC